MKRFDFKPISYSNENTIESKKLSSLFFSSSDINLGIYKKYKQLCYSPGCIGVNYINDINVYGEWGLPLNADKEFPQNLYNIGWFKEAFEHLFNKDPERFQLLEEGIKSKKESRNIGSYNACALMTFPGALTYGHWIVDIIFRYFFLSHLRLCHKVDKFIFPSSLGRWTFDYFDFLNIDEDDIVTLAQGEEITCQELYIPTVASFLPGSTLPVDIAKEVYADLKSYFVSKGSKIKKLNNSIVMLRHTPMTSTKERYVDLSQLEEFIVNVGGVIVDPLEYSASDLAILLSNCRLLIGQDSSALHNNAFIHADLVVIESEPRSNMLHVSIQDAIDKKISFFRCDWDGNEYFFDMERFQYESTFLDYYYS